MSLSNSTLFWNQSLTGSCPQAREVPLISRNGEALLPTPTREADDQSAGRRSLDGGTSAGFGAARRGRADLMDPTSAFISATCVAASTPVAVAGVRAYRSCGGLRLVNCPETMEEAIVKMHATRAMVSALVGRNDVRLRSCSRWPEKQGCDQACLAQIAASPNGCRAHALPVRSTTPRPAAWKP